MKIPKSKLELEQPGIPWTKFSQLRFLGGWLVVLAWPSQSQPKEYYLKALFTHNILLRSEVKRPFLGSHSRFKRSSLCLWHSFLCSFRSFVSFRIKTKNWQIWKMDRSSSPIKRVGVVFSNRHENFLQMPLVKNVDMYRVVINFIILHFRYIFHHFLKIVLYCMYFALFWVDCSWLPKK